MRGVAWLSQEVQTWSPSKHICRPQVDSGSTQMMSRFASFFGRGAGNEGENEQTHAPAPAPAPVPHQQQPHRHHSQQQASHRQPAPPPQGKASASTGNRPRSGSSGNSGSSRHKTGKRRGTSKTGPPAGGLSPRSVSALAKLEDFAHDADALEKLLAGVELCLQDYPRTPRARLLEAKDQIAQMNGNLEKLQYNGVDSIITAELESGKEKAKEKRKALNQRCDSLRERILQNSRDLARMLTAGAGE